MQGVRIVVMSIGASVLYGILHDQVTAHLCIEYFTLFHQRGIASDSPVLQGLVWGVIATWWVGLLLGVPLALAARSGSWPPLTPRDLVRPIGCLLLAMALCAAIAGIGGYLTGLHHPDQIVLDLDRRDWAPVASPQKWPFFLADYCAHNTSYAVGFIGGLVVVALTLWWRAQLADRSPA